MHLHTKEILVNDPNILYIDDIEMESETTTEATTPMDDDYGTMLQPEKIDVDDKQFDNYLNSELLIDCSGIPVQVHVTKRVRNQDSELVGMWHADPKLDTHEYEHVTMDGVVEHYTANQIAENMYEQCDAEGHSHLVLSEIVNHSSAHSAISIAEGYLLT